MARCVAARGHSRRFSDHALLRVQIPAGLRQNLGVALPKAHTDRGVGCHVHHLTAEDSSYPGQWYRNATRPVDKLAAAKTCRYFRPGGLLILFSTFLQRDKKDQPLCPSHVAMACQLRANKSPTSGKDHRPPWLTPRSPWGAGTSVRGICGGPQAAMPPEY